MMYAGSKLGLVKDGGFTKVHVCVVCVTLNKLTL